MTSILSWYLNYDMAISYLAFSRDNLLGGKVWTLVTALFLHADLEHLLGNMVFLFVFGNTLEKEFGATKTLTVFFFGGIVSFFLGIFFYAHSTPLIGASAAIFTLTAIAMLVKPLQFSFLFFMPLGLVAVIYFVYNVMAVHLGFGGNVAYVSHVIGFLLGVPFGIAWSEKWAKNLIITGAMFLLYLAIVTFLLPSILSLIGGYQLFS